MAIIYYREHSNNAMHTIPLKLVKESELAHLTGFMSAYAFPKETANWLLNNYSEKNKVTGSIIGLKQSKMPVTTNRILVDFDEDVKRCARILYDDLKKWEIEFQVYESGGRSIHFHIHCVRHIDTNVPASQRKWMEDYCKSREIKCDDSIYRHNSLYRLPNTLHTSTGKPKKLLEHYSTSRTTELYYDLLDDQAYANVYDGSDTDLLFSFWRLMLDKIGSSQGRRFHLWKLVDHAERLGMKSDEILEHLYFWNNNLGDNRLSEDQLLEKFYSI